MPTGQGDTVSFRKCLARFDRQLRGHFYPAAANGHRSVVATPESSALNRDRAADRSLGPEGIRRPQISKIVSSDGNGHTGRDRVRQSQQLVLVAEGEAEPVTALELRLETELAFTRFER